MSDEIPCQYFTNKTVMKTKAPQAIYQLKVTLVGSKPPIWRRILVPDNITLGKLHMVLQVVMGWLDEHLHQFKMGMELYGVPDKENSLFGMSVQDENKTILSSLLLKEKDSITYDYDFGDDWEHKLTLEKRLPYDSTMQLPLCIKGKRACPPEDCGGIWGYMELIEIMSDPSHPEHEERAEWLEEAFGIENFEPECFDLEETNATLEMEFKER